MATSNVARLLITALCFAVLATAQNRKLRVSGLAAGENAVALLIRAEGPSCTGSRTLSVPSGALVDLNPHIDAGCWTCSDANAGLAIHSRGRTVVHVGSDKICNPSRTIKKKLGKRNQMTVHLWPASAAVVAKARDDLANTEWILYKNFSGIRLKVEEHPPDSSVSSVDCDNPPTNTLSSSRSLNIYYGGGAANIHCNTAPNETQYLLIHDTPVLGDIAHEIGHALGLNQSDNELPYDVGHTTDATTAGFDCSNCLWEDAPLLANHLSLGQIFWQHWSKSSVFARRRNQEIVCTEIVGDPSACPPFSARFGPPPVTKCEPCDVATADSDSICTPSGLLAALQARFQALSEHRDQHGGLDLGSANQDAFIENWKRFHEVSIEVAAVARTIEGTPERERGLKRLRELLDKNFANSAFLRRAIDLITKNQRRIRCATRALPRHEQLPSRGGAAAPVR